MGESDSSLFKTEITPVELDGKYLAIETQPGAEYTAGDAYYQYKVTAISFRRGEHYKITRYYSIKVLSSTGVATFSTFNMPFEPASEGIFVNYLKVYDNAGQLKATGNPTQYFVMDDSDSQMATDGKILNIPITGLLPGYRFELAVTWEKHNPGETFSFFSDFLNRQHPIVHSYLIVQGDIEELAYFQRNVDSLLTGPGHLSWYVSMPLTFPWETYQDDLENFLPVVYLGSKTGSWAAGAREYMQAIEFGRRAWIPNDGDTIYHNKYYNITDLVPEGLGRKHALILDPADPRLKQLPDYSAGSSTLASDRQVNLREDGTVSVREKIEFQGYHAGNLRSFLLQYDSVQQQQQLQGYLNSSGTAIRLDKMVTENLTATDQPLSLELEYTLNKNFIHLKDQLIGELPAVWERVLLYQPHTAERQGPLRVYPLGITSHITLQAPDGTTFLKPALQAAEQNTYADWKIDRIHTNNKIEITFAISLHKATYPPREFNTFAAALNSAVEALEEGVVLEE